MPKDQKRLQKAGLNLAAKIIREGARYADSLGFKPQSDFYDAALLLDGADPDACPTEIPLGLDGKPYSVSGPFDDVPRIMARLERAVGPGNFEFLVGGPGGALLDDELP